MKYVRLPLLSRKFLMTVEEEPLIKTSSQCKDYLIEAMKYHLMPEQRHCLKSERTPLRSSRDARPTLFSVGRYSYTVSNVSEGGGECQYL